MMVNTRDGGGEKGKKKSEKVLGKEEEGIMINDGKGGGTSCCYLDSTERDAFFVHPHLIPDYI